MQTARRQSLMQLPDERDGLSAASPAELSAAVIRLATEAAEIGVWDLDMQTNVLVSSPRLKAMFGIPPGGRFTMDDFYAGLHPDDRERTGAAFAAALDPARRLDYDVEYRTVGREDGATRWVAAKGRGMFDDDGMCLRAIGTTRDITARRVAEQRARDSEARLAVSEARFRAAVDAMQGVLWTNSPDGRMLGEQAGWSALTGQTREQYEGYGWAAAVHPDDAQPTVQAWNEAVAQGTPFVFEHRLRGSDGAYRRFAVRAVPLHESDGRLREWVGVHTNINAKTEAEADRTRLAALVEQSGEFIATVQADGSMSFVNEAGQRLLGLDAEALGRLHLADCASPASQDVLRAAVLPAVAERGGWSGELDFRHVRTGDDIPVLLNLFAVREGAGRAAGYGVVARDLRERRRTELALQQLNESLEQAVAERTAELRANEARLRTIFETSHQLQGLLTLDGTMLDANAISLKVIEAGAADVLGRPFWECPWFTATPGAGEVVRAAVEGAAQGQTIAREISLQLPSGLRTFEMSVRPIHDGAGRVFAIVPDALDVTERRQAQDALRQAQKMEAFGQLTGGVAHDFNNLLQAISGGLEMLGRKHVHSEAGHKLIELVQGAADRGAQLTKQLLAFARKQPLESRPTDVNATVAASGALLERSLGGVLLIERRLDDDVWPALTDAGQLDVAVLNLVLNARDAMPDGGTIAVSTRNIVAPGEADLPADLLPGDYVRLAVSDSGSGMSEEVRQRVFEPFFTTKGVGKGTGLGLSQVYGFAHQSRGTVRILSAPGQGTTVEIYLPRAITDDTTPPPAKQAALWQGRETVLVVDDDSDVRELAVVSLVDLGYRVLAADSGPAGLEMLGREPSIDLLLADYAMPGMNGAEMVRLGRRVRPQLRVLFMTGYADMEAVAEHAGPDRILHKPFKLAELAERVALTLASATSRPR